MTATQPPNETQLLSYVDSVRLTMESIRDLGISDQVLTAQYRQLLDLAAQLDLGRDIITLHKEFRLAVSKLIDLAEARRLEIAEARRRPLDLLTVIEMESETDTELERQMGQLPPPPAPPEAE